MSNSVVHFEIAVNDDAQGRDFFSKLFDWDFAVMPDMGTYALVAGGEGGIGGGVYKYMGNAPRVLFYVDVVDLQKYLDQAIALGGKLIHEPMPIPGVGGFALFADPEGNVIGLYTSNFPGVERMESHEPVPKKGCALNHFEIGVADGKKAIDFYSKLFGWKVQWYEEWKYGMVEPVGKGIGGGICQVPDQAPYVTLYTTVSSLKEYLKKVEQFGGKTVMPPTPIEGYGASALFSNPDGTVLGLFSSEGA